MKVYLAVYLFQDGDIEGIGSIFSTREKAEAIAIKDKYSKFQLHRSSGYSIMEFVVDEEEKK